MYSWYTPRTNEKLRFLRELGGRRARWELICFFPCTYGVAMKKLCSKFCISCWKFTRKYSFGNNRILVSYGNISNLDFDGIIQFFKGFLLFSFSSLYFKYIIYSFFNFHLHISSVISGCMCVEHYWNDSEREKILTDTRLSFWILPPQIALEMAWDWSGDYKLRGMRQLFPALASFFNVIPGVEVRRSINWVQIKLMNANRCV